MDDPPDSLPDHWSVTAAFLTGIAIGFVIQNYLQSRVDSYAQAMGLPRFIVQLTLIFGPMVAAGPVFLLLKTRFTWLQACAALVLGALAAGYVGLALELLAWVIGW